MEGRPRWVEPPGGWAASGTAAVGLVLTPKAAAHGGSNETEWVETELIEAGLAVEGGLARQQVAAGQAGPGQGAGTREKVRGVERAAQDASDAPPQDQ